MIFILHDRYEYKNVHFIISVILFKTVLSNRAFGTVFNVIWPIYAVI